MRLLDLFCGAGGAAMGYFRAGYEVIGVDNNPQPNYPFEFYQCEWNEIMNLEPDAIHASPPCQKFSAYRRKDPARVGNLAPDLIGKVRETLKAVGLPYVIENVPGAPLENPVRLCGSSFGLDVRRHRLFESSVELGLTPPCDHGRQLPRFPSSTGRKNLRKTVEVGVWRIPLETQQRAMGIDWMTVNELSQAIPPAYTEWIGQRIKAAQATVPK